MANTPRYMEIANELRQQITTGRLRPGDQLPTEAELAKQHETARNTIRDAIGILKNLRLVEARSGIGTFVAIPPVRYKVTLTPDERTGFGGGEGKAWVAEAEAKGRTARTGDTEVHIKVATPVMAEALNVSTTESLVGRHQERYIDEVAWSLQTSYYPMDFVTRGATELLRNTDIDQGTMDYLEESLGIKQVGYRDEIVVRPPDAREVDFFNIPDSGAVQILEHRRTAFDAHGHPCRYTVTAYPTDRNIFVIEAMLPVPDETA
ncbi:GntR family transcriptional regulator [Actinomadura macrotermitis]|uniref:Putative HTH-type transcriptional regulator YydK n=1 Tax=Actinomadura macrotermitis TaxID=2585200 RepID=A0A7K0C303_9ACTN|nr:GntR family transcriptional regulator [Actinomadura macrotermitis]MQY07204.1 putative HTH-type transcriptional regulator YydK [Actinomadura macrotermitis]